MKKRNLNNDLKLIEKLKKIVETKRSCEVMRIKRLSKTSMNDVFKIETDKDTIIARIFKKKNFPDCKKLIWLDKKLRKSQIDVPSVLFCSHESKPFRYGYMLTSYIEGREGWQAMKSGDVSLPSFYKKLGQLIKQIHSIKLTKSGKVKAASFKDGFKWFEEVLTQFQKKIGLSEDEYSQIKLIVTDTLTHFAPRFKSALCHCDIGPYNTIYTKDGKIIPIDWDLAEADSIFRDFSPLTIGVKEMDGFGKRKDVIKRIQKSFLLGYGKTEFSKTEIQKILDAYHLISLVYNSLAYADKSKDSRGISTIKKEIKEITDKYKKIG